MIIYIIQQRINDEIVGTSEWATLWATQDEEQAQKDIAKLQKKNEESGDILTWEYKITTSTLY